MVQIAFFVLYFVTKLQKNRAEERNSCWFKTSGKITFFRNKPDYPWFDIPIPWSLPGCVDIWFFLFGHFVNAGIR